MSERTTEYRAAPGVDAATQVEDTIDPLITALEEATGKLAVAYFLVKQGGTLAPEISRQILGQRQRDAKQALGSALARERQRVAQMRTAIDALDELLDSVIDDEECDNDLRLWRDRVGLLVSRALADAPGQRGEGSDG